VPLKKKVSFLLLLGFVIFLLLFLFKVKGEMVDFEVNHKAGKRLRTGETLYQTEDGHYMFKYFPSSALLYLPLSFLPLDAAKAIWYFVVVFSSCFLFYISYRILPLEAGKSLYLVFLPPLILAKFLLREIQLGQINAVVTLVLLFMVWFLTSEKNGKLSKRETYAGILWGIAMALKPHALIFFPYFLVKKKWRAFLSGLGFLFISLCVPSLFYGFRGNIEILKEWISTLSRSTPALFTSQDNISIIAFFMKWTGNQNLSYVFSGLIIALLALLVLVIILRGKEIAQAPVLECSILLILIPLVSPLGWDYTLLMSVLGVLIILQNFFKYSRFWRGFLVVNFFIISFSLYNVLGRELYSVFMSWSVITVNFLILIGYLTYLRFKKIC